MFRMKKSLILILGLVATAVVCFLAYPGEAKAHDEYVPYISGMADNPGVRILARDSDGLGHDRRQLWGRSHRYRDGYDRHLRHGRR